MRLDHPWQVPAILWSVEELPEDGQALVAREVEILRRYERDPLDLDLQLQAQAAAERIAAVVIRYRRPDLL